MQNRCDICITDKSRCKDCRDNPIYKNVPRISLFSAYVPTCPFGMGDCVGDPAYIKYHYPDWYKELYGDISPEEASKQSCSDYEHFWECYDDEDK